MCSTLKPGDFTGVRKAEMPRASPALPEVRANTRSTVAVCMPVLNRFMPLITQSPPCFVGRGLHEGGVRAVVGLGQAEGDALLAGEHAFEIAVLLLLGAETVQQQGDREIADDRALVLQVVVQAEALVREMFADDRHGEVGTVLAAQRLGQARSADGPPCRRGGASRPGAPPIRDAAGRHCPSRCGRARGDGRRSGYCRSRARAAGSRAR